MLVKLIEKAEGKMVVEFAAENGQEALIMAMAVQPEDPLRADLTCRSLRPPAYLATGAGNPSLFIDVGEFRLGTAEPLK